MICAEGVFSLDTHSSDRVVMTCFGVRPSLKLQECNNLLSKTNFQNVQCLSISDIITLNQKELKTIFAIYNWWYVSNPSPTATIGNASSAKGSL